MRNGEAGCINQQCINNSNGAVGVMGINSDRNEVGDSHIEGVEGCLHRFACNVAVGRSVVVVGRVFYLGQ